MCEHCTPFVHPKFSTEKDVQLFEKTLEAKCIDGTFIQVVHSQDTEEIPLQSTYQCTFCGNEWTIAIPENTVRDYFLATTDTHQHNNNRYFQANFSKQSKGNCGCCLGMFLLCIIVIIYGIYSLFSFIFEILF